MKCKKCGNKKAEYLINKWEHTKNKLYIVHEGCDKCTYRIGEIGSPKLIFNKK